MFEKLYLSSDHKITPSEKLIEDTKEKMYREINKKKSINLYKYSAIAACAIIVFAVISLYSPNRTPIEYAPTNSFEVSHSITATDSSKHIPSGNLFMATDSQGANFSVQSSSLPPFLDAILDFIKAILQWFYELLF